MSWRTIYVSSSCHLSYKGGYLIIRNDEIQMIHLSEINTLMIDNTASSISTYLLSELIKAKVKIIFCDEKHNPHSELVPYYLSYNSSKTIRSETEWNQNNCDKLWAEIVRWKIYYQAAVLIYSKNNEKAFQLIEYKNNVLEGDVTNREGHAAKVYFNALFGNNFSRDIDNNINAALNYGYSILLSMFNREIVNSGYITQIGIHHKGEYNPFNLSCDLMEPFRPIIDKIVIDNIENNFDKEYRFKLIEIMNKRFLYKNKNMYLSNVISKYVKDILENLKTGKIDSEIFEYDSRETYESNSVL